MLRDPRRLPARIRRHLEAENAHAEALLAPLAALRARIETELRGRIDPEERSLPDDDGPWTYLERYEPAAEHPRLLRRPRAGGKWWTILDLDAESEGTDCFDAGQVEWSPDHALLGWTRDTDGAELYTLVVRDLASGADVETIDEVGDFAWATPQVLFYTRLDAELRPSRIYRHRVGEDPANDALVHEETDPRFVCSVATSASREYLFLDASASDTSEVRVLRGDAPFAEPVLVEPRREGVEYDVEHRGERFLILTNADGATDFRIVAAPVATPGRAHWTDVVPHVPGRLLLEHAVYRDWLLWTEREDALPRVRWMGADGEVRGFETDEAAYALGLEPLIEHASGTVRVAHSSPTTPERVFAVELATGARRTVREQRIPAGHDPSRYRTARRQARSADGSEVPVTLLHLTDTALDGSAPCLLHVYGAYGESVPAAFDGWPLPLVERGFVHAIAHVRGGQEKGRRWYEDSRGAGRERVIEDLVAVGETLAADGTVARGRICLHGASAGGLVVGAALNRAPAGLWGAAILDVPFVDALATMLDPSLPLTPGEWVEWGDPIEDEAAFRIIRAHSPLDDIRARDYPPILVTAGISDSRVMWWEPAKWVARLRERRANDAPLAFVTNLAAGHFGDSGRYAGLDEEARALAFAVATVGG